MRNKEQGEHIRELFVLLNEQHKKDCKEKHRCDSCGDICESDDMRGSPQDGYTCFGCIADGDGYAQDASEKDD